jgi:8-oxo-dGTP pyrophosphatase MutT (NUDIX family)
MREDFAFGGIVFKTVDGAKNVLLAKKPQFSSWDLPKGHKDGDETDIEAAQREVAEETGYKNVKFSGDKVSVSYESEKNGEKLAKTVTFYIGEHEGEETPVQNLDDDEDEQKMEVSWVPLDEAVNLVTFEPFQNALKEAISKI